LPLLGNLNYGKLSYSIKLGHTFVPAKAAQRSLAESMARHLGPAGVHVATVIVDGVVDTPSTRKIMPNKPDDFFMKPDDIADAVIQLTQKSLLYGRRRLKYVRLARFGDDLD
jgi:NAD(P)-dependent dehydrogenase (short-subunit alcohol dehydrogenase family)